jgi:hypothetical protein
MTATDHDFASRVVQGAFRNEPVSILVKIFTPLQEEKFVRCKFEIWKEGALQRESSVIGEDGIHALMLALWKIETDLTHMPPFNEMTFEGDGHFGFGFIHSKNVWESVHGKL